MTYSPPLPRSMTGTELNYIRMDGQSSMLYLAILKPATVYTALINEIFTTDDKVTQITYDTGIGTLADVLPGMTLWIGSSAGANDLGQVRIRKTPTSTIFYVGENSDIPWADNLYLTIVDEFGLWARHISIDSSNVPYMDADIAYSDQHTNTNPIPILGPRYVPVWLTGATVVVPFDASLSYTLPDTSISSYAWTAPGASATSGMATATPSITYNAVGLYRVQCVITAANGKTTTAFVYIQVYDRLNNLPIEQFELKDCSASSSDGGWKFAVTMYDQSQLSSVYDRAQVVLFARDFYGTNEVSIGQIANRENIIAVGWIDGESILEDPDGSYVEFTVESAHAWAKRLSGFPIGIQNATTTASAWTNWQGLTVDNSLYHLFFWQSTLIPVVDVFLTGDTRVSAEQYAPGDMTLWDQLQYILKNTLLGTYGSDRFNRFWCEIDTQLTPPASRSSYNVVMSMQYQDWRDQMKITRIPVHTTSQVNLSGVSISLPNTPTAIFSLAPGHVFERWGRAIKQDRMLLADQASANQLAAMKLAWDNHDLEFEPDLAGNNRMLDIFPSHQYVDIPIVASDTPRGFTFSGNTIVREIHISFDKSTKDDSNFLQTSWRMERETFPGNSANGDIPVSSTPTLPPLPKPAPLPPPPGINPTPTGIPKIAVITIDGYGVFYTTNFDTSDPLGPSWYAWNNGIAGTYSLTDTLFEIEVSQVSGRWYLQIGYVAILSAPQLGADWVKVFDLSDVTAAFPGQSGYHVNAFGINRMSPDELIIYAGYNWGMHYGGGWFYGSSAGVTLAGTDAGTGLMFGRLVFAAGNWSGYITYFNSMFLRVKRDASAVVLSVNVDGSGAGGVNDSHLYPAGVDAHTVFLANSALLTFKYTADLGVSINPVTQPPAPYRSYELYESMGVDPTGLFLLLGTDTISTYKSSDGGATWGTIVFTEPVTAIWNTGGQNTFILGGGSQVWYTPDFGGSFINKTGNLQTWVPPTFNILQIRSLPG